MSSKLEELREALAQHSDPRDAFRAFAGEPLNAIAKRVGMRRTDLNMMLEPGATRRYTAGRRQIEAEYGLPAYSLDELLGNP